MLQEHIAILLVEDNPAEVRLLRETLRETANFRFKLLHVDRLAAGIERVEAGGVDIVLLDLSLPDSQGLETFLELRARATTVPIVVLTGIDDETIAISAVQQGAQDYLVKGEVDSKLLERSIRYAIERSRAEQGRLQLIREQAARAEAEATLRARDEFLSIVAHELKNPVTSILGYSQLLQRRAEREGNSNSRDQRALQVLNAQARRMSRLINSLLDLSRLQSGQLTTELRPLDLGQLIDRMVTELRLLLEQDRIDVCDLDEQLIIEGDELRLEQVLFNLLHNALKYSPDAERVTVTLARQNGQACLEISDRGIGIPDEELSNLFTLFYRANNVKREQIEGMGLGLYVVKEIVALHGGHVEVESEEGSGTTFRVYLPLRTVAETGTG